MKPAFCLAALIGAVFLARPASAEEEKWTDLLDSKLSQWELWMGVPHTSVQGLPEGTPHPPDHCLSIEAFDR